MRVSADGGYSNAVDLYNSASGAWSTAHLSVARWGLAATSVGNVAIFAGGHTCKFGFALCHRGAVLELLCEDDVCLSRVCRCCFVLYAV
jgi:hypothetical protein